MPKDSGGQQTSCQREIRKEWGVWGDCKAELQPQWVRWWRRSKFYNTISSSVYNVRKLISFDWLWMSWNLVAGSGEGRRPFWSLWYPSTYQWCKVLQIQLYTRVMDMISFMKLGWVQKFILLGPFTNRWTHQCRNKRMASVWRNQ